MAFFGAAESRALIQDVQVEVRAIPYLKDEMWGTRCPAPTLQQLKDEMWAPGRGKNLFDGDLFGIFAG
jgi:hypothetical protein